jgi:hypothetical protein
MPSQLPALEASPEILKPDTMPRFVGRVIRWRFEDPDVTAVYPNAQPQRIWTIQLAKHSVG